MPFELTIIGSNSAVAAFGRHPTAQVLHVNHEHYLIDCGEGTQFRFSKVGIKPSRISKVFISHLHGDHYFGLPGLITSFGLNRRTEPLQIFGPAPLEGIIRAQLEAASTTLPYDLDFFAVDPEQGGLILKNDNIRVSSFPTTHRIPCSGFRFDEQPAQRHIISDKIREHGIHHSQIPAIKAGGDFTTEDGRIVPNVELTTDPAAPRSYAYSADTAYNEAMVDVVKEVDLLYHEATFNSESEGKAELTFHSTARQAAKIAHLSMVKRLIIGHFSARYSDLSGLLEEARAVFPNTDLAKEGETFVMPKSA